MVADLSTARDEMHRIFDDAWEAGAGAVNGGVVPAVKYEGLPQPKAFPPRDAQWGRMRIRHTLAEQSAMSDTVARFEKIGTVTIQIFASLELDEPANRAADLAQIAKGAFEGKKTPSQVWFRNVTVNEIGVDDAWYNINVLADFEYDELT